MDRTTSTRARARARRTALLGASALALVLLAAPERALAQAQGPDTSRGFQSETFTVPAGAAQITPSAQHTQIDVQASRTVINWTPTSTATSGTIDFLPNLYSAAFSSGLADYTVLNRILPGGSATIGLNGSITSTVSNGEGQSPGGNVWFYTPNGFVIGKTGTINVGGLILTTNDIPYSVDQQGAVSFLDANGAINFRGPNGSTGSIVNDGLIVGNNTSSYIALVAPRIEQRGFVSADRSIAYVAAEQVDLTINAGNFDIAIVQGTTDGTGIVHSGTTTGALSTGSTDIKAIHFAAVAKNTALTMLLSGQIGYKEASSVFEDGSSIILTAGGTPAAGGVFRHGNISIGEGTFFNSLTGAASGDITVAPPAPGPSSETSTSTQFLGFTSLSGGKSVHLTAAAGTRISATRGLFVESKNAAGGGDITITALGGASPGEIDVAGSLSASASHFGATSTDGKTGLDGQGGTISLTADGGVITAGNLSLNAHGFGGQGTESGGDGFGGTIDIGAGFGGTITAGYISVNAGGDGGPSFDSREGAQPGTGGIGHGGTIKLADSLGDPAVDPTGGTLALGSVFLDASAVGGNPMVQGAGLGGDAFGGDITITFDRQSQTLASLDAYARAADGDGAVDPVGGTIDMTVGGGIEVALGSLTLDTSVLASINSPVGAFGKGGTINLTVSGDAALYVSGITNLRSRADISNFFSNITVNSTPDLTGGTIDLTVDGGIFATRDLDIDATANNIGAATRAGFAKGGTVLVRAANGGSIQTQPQFSDCTECSPGGFFEIDAEGYGTGGGSANIVTGGDITLAAETGGTITAGSGPINLNASAKFGIAQGGQASGVTAQGGTIAIDAVGGTIASSIKAEADGKGGDADNVGGSGTGGTINVRILGGTLVDSLDASASGTGGFSNIVGDAGDGIGGRITLVSDETAVFTNFGIEFDGSGIGGQATSGRSGDGYGGSAQVDILGGTIAWNQANFFAPAFGGLSTGTGSVAGSAFGSAAGVKFHVGDGAVFNVPSIDLIATAFAGYDGGANEAVGGLAELTVDSGASVTTGTIRVSAGARLTDVDSDSTTYVSTPDAQGGTASLIADNGAISADRIEINASGMTAGALTAAGTATGGMATMGAANGGAITLGTLSEGSGLILAALGLGGDGPAPAHATGGTATLYAAGGTITVPYTVEVQAGAGAGEYAGRFAASDLASNGFNAQGGTAVVELRSGTGDSLIDVASDLTINADGDARTSPVAGAGGNGKGGTARLSVASGTLDVNFGIELKANGLGGDADERAGTGAAYLSGVGEGGTAEFRQTGGTATSERLVLFADGDGGSGRGFMAGATPSLAGIGRGGTARIIASGGTLNNSVAVAVTARGGGGNGAFNPNAGPGGDGADGFGGTATFTAPTGGSADLNILDFMRLDVNAFGGSGGNSAGGTRGNGGNAVGGAATIALSDIPFDFGVVALEAAGLGGSGAIVGADTGGAATFSLVDSSSAAVGPRSIRDLEFYADGFTETARSVGGRMVLTVQVAGPGSALTITDNLFLKAQGVIAPAGNGFTGTISGAPLTVGGDVTLITPGKAVLTATAPGALVVDGLVNIDVGGTFTTTGAISVAGNASVIAASGINMTDLSVGGTTLLRALNGPVTVSNNLRSVGAVTVLGRSINLVSLGALTFADADATAGDLAIKTAGHLLLATADATGAVTLTSTGGSINNTGAVNGVGITYIAAEDVHSDAPLASGGALTVDAGGTFTAPGTVSAVGPVSLTADLGMTLDGVASGGTTLLQADSGAISVASLTSPGLVTAIAQSLALASPGALSFADAQATAGNISITTAGNLLMTKGSASGALTLTSGGTITGGNPLTAGGHVAISGNTGIAIVALTGGATTSLTSANGTVGVVNLNSVGAVTASGRAIDIGSTGALTFADLDATAGDVRVQTTGNLTVDTVDATGSITLASSGGALQANGAINGVGITLSSLANLTLTGGLATTGPISLTSTSGSVAAGAPISAGGTLFVSGNSGITLDAASSGGATTLTAANGAVAVRDLTSVGAVTAMARSIHITSSGALTFANAQATAGGLTLHTTGALALQQASATGNIDLTSTGGSVSWTGAGPVTAGGNVSVDANGAIAFGALTSGGSTSLDSATSTVSVLNLTSPGAVTAVGTGISIASTGALSFADARATAGSITLRTGGNLALQQASATGAIDIASVAGAITATGPVVAGGQVIASGDQGLTFGTLTSGDATTLTATNGAITITGLSSVAPVTATARSIAIASPGALRFGSYTATAGGLTISTVGELIVSNASATGAIDLASTTSNVFGTNAITAGGNLAVAGATGIGLQTATSGGTTLLTSAGGRVSVTNLNSVGPVTARGQSVNIGSLGALSFADLDALAGDVTVQTAGNLVVNTVDATRTPGTFGSVSLTSSGGSVTATGPVVAAGLLSVSGNTGVSLTSATAGASTVLTSVNGAVQVANLNSVGAVTARGRSVTIGSNGALTFSDLDATAGNVAVQTAGNLAVNTVDATGSITLTSTGGALQTNGSLNGNGIALSSAAGIQIAAPLSTAGALSLTSTGGSVGGSGPVTAGGNLTVSGNTGIALAAATSGGTTTLSAANGTVGVTNLNSPGAVTATGRGIDIGSSGALSFANAQATAGDLRIVTAGNLALAQANATGAATLASTGGSLAATGPVTAGGTVSAAGQTGVTFATLTSGGTTALSAPAGAVVVTALTSPGAVTVTARSVDLRSTGALTVSNAQATAGNIALQTGQALTVGTASATGTATLTAGGDLRNTGLVSAAGLTMSGANVTASGELRSSAALSLNAQQLLTIGSLAAGTTISTVSGDIAIGSTARLGSRGLTKSLTISTQSSSRPMYIGGTGQSGEFSLDRTEATRLFADEQIAFVQRSGEGSQGTFGEVRIGELAMAFGGDSANIGSGGRLKVDAFGRVEVNGAVTLTTVSATDRFSIDPTRIDVIAGSGSIVMQTAGGSLMGVLELQANTIAVADRTTLDTIAALSDFAAISAALDKPGPSGPAGGTLQAGTINLLASEVYIQNAGATSAYADRRGFRANAVTITSGSSSQSESSSPRIAINGVIVTPGGELFGLDTAQGISINGVKASEILLGASISINGCGVGINCGIPEYSFGGLASDELAAVLAASEEADGPAGQMVQSEENEPLITPPLVDEPITGVGNDDLWQVKCDPEDANSSCPTEESTE